MPDLTWRFHNGQAAVNLQEKIRKGQEGINREAKEGIQTNRQLEAVSRRVWNANATGVEKFRAELNKLDAARDKEKISTEHHALEIERLGAKYLSTGEKGAAALLRIRRKARDLRAEFEAGMLTSDEYKRKLRVLNAEYDRSVAGGEAAFGSKALGMFGGFISAAGAAASAIGLIRSEIDQAAAAADRISSSQITQAEARRSLKLSVAGRTDIDPETKMEVRRLVESEANRISADLGIDQVKVDKTVEHGISASATPQRGIVFSEQGLAFTQGIEGTEAFVGGMLDTANALGLKARNNEEVRHNAQTAIGFLNEVRQASRVTSTDKVAQNVPRVLQAYRGQGVDAPTAAALFSGLTIAGADPHGDVARTAAMNLLPKMDKFFRENQFTGIRPEDHDTAAEQLALLMHDPRVSGNFINSSTGKEFVDSVTTSQAFLDRVAKNSDFRAAGRSSIIGFFANSDSEARKSFAINRSRLRNFDNLRQNAIDGLTFLREGNDQALRGDQLIGSSHQQHVSRFEPFVSQEKIEQVKDLMMDSGLSHTRFGAGLDLWMRAGTQVTQEELARWINGKGPRIDHARRHTDEELGEMNHERDSLNQVVTFTPKERSALDKLIGIADGLNISADNLNRASSNLNDATRPDSIPYTGPQE